MATAKKTAAKAPAKRAVKKATAKKAPAKKVAAKKATAKKAPAKKAAAKKATARTAAARENLVVASKLREVIRGHDIRMSSELAAAVNDELHTIVEKAVARAKGNNRGTVRPTDL